MRLMTLAILALALLFPVEASADASSCWNLGFMQTTVSSFGECTFNATGVEYVDVDPLSSYEVTVWQSVTAGQSGAIDIELYDCSNAAIDETHATCRLLRTASQASLTGVFPSDQWAGVRAGRLVVKVVTHPGAAQDSKLRLVKE